MFYKGPTIPLIGLKISSKNVGWNGFVFFLIKHFFQFCAAEAVRASTWDSLFTVICLSCAPGYQCNVIKTSLFKKAADLVLSQVQTEKSTYLSERDVIWVKMKQWVCIEVNWDYHILSTEEGDSINVGILKEVWQKDRLLVKSKQSSRVCGDFLVNHIFNRFIDCPICGLLCVRHTERKVQQHSALKALFV